MSLVGFFSVYLMLSVLALLPVRHRALRVRGIIAAVILPLMFVPVMGSTLGGFLFSLSGELSITSLLLLSATLLLRLFDLHLIGQTELKAIMLLSATLGLVLYLLALTPAAFDLYAQGYAYTPAAWGIFGFVLVLGIVAIYQAWLTVLLALCLGSLACLFNLWQSHNYWDHLIDAPLFLYSIYFWVKQMARKYFTKTCSA